jgi:preprotein translocase subunit YajC
MTSVLLQAQGGQSPFGMLILMGGMFLIMYLFMIRPQMKRMKEAKKFQEALSVGDKVVTTSGIHGKVVEIGEKDLVISIDQGRMRVEKAAVSPSGFVAEQAK